MKRYKLTISYPDSTFEVLTYSTYSEALSVAEYRVGTTCQVFEDTLYRGLLAGVRGSVGGMLFAIATIEVSA